MNNRVNVEFGLSAVSFLSFPPKPWLHPRIMNKSSKAISQLLQVPFGPNFIHLIENMFLKSFTKRLDI